MQVDLSSNSERTPLIRDTSSNYNGTLNNPAGVPGKVLHANDEDSTTSTTNDGESFDNVPRTKRQLGQLENKEDAGSSKHTLNL